MLRERLNKINETGFLSSLYVDGNIGLVDTNIGGANTAAAAGTAWSSSSGLSGTKTAFAFDLNGGYNWNIPNSPVIIGAGMIYINNSKITSNGTLTYQGISNPESLSYDSYSYGAYLEPGVVIQRNFLIYGRFGVVHNHIGNLNYDLTNYYDLSLQHSGGRSIYYGLGVQYLVTKNVGLNFEWDSINQSMSYGGLLAGTPNETMHNNDFLVGISYYF